MSITRRILFGAAASWFSRGVTILLGLVLMPVLFRTLPKQELGIWLLLGQSWATMGILDLGFGVTLTRRIAFAKGRSGSDPNVPLNPATNAEIADLMATGLRIYRVLAVFAFTVAFGLGFFYLRSLSLDAVALTSVWAAWGILCLSQAMMVWATPWTCLLQGVGYIGWDAILASFVLALTLIGQIVAALCGGGLVSLAVMAALGAFVQRAVILSFSRRQRPELAQLRGKWCGETFRSMIPLAGRAWLTALGGSMILYTDQFVIASFQGAQELPAYRAAWVLVHNITVVAVTLGVSSGVFISHLWQSRDLAQVHRAIERNLRFGWLVMLAGAAVLLFAGEPLFKLWLGTANFVGYPVLLAFLMTEALEAQSYIISCASRATGDEGFAWSSLAGGFLKLVLSITLAHHYGLIGVALGTVVALLLTNHWYVPWHGLGRLGYSRRSLLSRTLAPCLAWFLMLSSILALVRRGTIHLAPIFQVGATTGVVFAMFLGALWTLALEPGQRLKIVDLCTRRVISP